MQPSNKRLFLILPLLLAICWDQLFWKYSPGISFPIFVGLCLGVVTILTSAEGQRAKPGAILLAVLALVFSLGVFLRAEPFTRFVDLCLSLASLIVLALTWLGGDWWRYGLSDYIYNGARLLGFALGKPAQILRQGKTLQAEAAPTIDSDVSSGQGSTKTNRAAIRALLYILLGLALAWPVVLILGLLLAQADPMFSQEINRIIELMPFERWSEYLIRLGFILAGAYLLSGVYLYALLASSDEKISSTGNHAETAAFLNWLVSATILSSVNLLFAFFVGIQFRYFFGGQANIHLNGYTYAEYARRGFGELVLVAVISLGLFLGLSLVTQRPAGRPRRTFSGLGMTLIGLVTIMLISAFQRLLLYEAAYGFTRSRAYTHIFMAWLGVLLLATVILEGLGRLRSFALALVLVVAGFGLSLNLVGVDALTARQNTLRAVGGQELDRGYLLYISNDAVPVLFELYSSSSLPQTVKDQLGATLACRVAQETSEAVPWPSFNWPEAQARRLYRLHQDELAAYPTRREERGWQVAIEGVYQDCDPSYWRID